LRFQKTSEYAIRVMVFLVNNRDELYSTNRLHKILKIPYKYLGRLMHTLTKAGFLEVVRGKQGGYKINDKRPPIYLYEIIGVIEGLDSYDRCVLGFEECSDENPCTLHKHWAKQRDSLKEMIYNINLKDLEGGLNIKY
jgi:Rrf2 family protein